ncbi:DUF1566 domain-containing protein [Desulfobacterales bacterium HSG16]|nr:DUF1566 domain-containing protein [Desulfobacterales bacterium HSG16]
MNESLNHKKAVRAIKEFRRKYDDTVFDLVAHAALPVALSSEMLHLIRINFFIDIPDPPPFTSESDILLSSNICQEIGDDLYEIIPSIRDELLKSLIEKHGQKRIKELAGLIWQYTKQSSSWHDNDRLERAQQLTALNFLDSERALEWLKDAEEKNYSAHDVMVEREWFVAMRNEIKRGDLSKLFDKDKPVEIETRKVDAEPEPQEIQKNGHFITYDNGTVLDTKTGLMWATEDNGEDINWYDAKRYCENYRGGRYSDWRMPSIDELKGLYDESLSGYYIAGVENRKVYLTSLIKLSNAWVWSAEFEEKKDGSRAALFDFITGYRYWGPPIIFYGERVLLVRGQLNI